VFTVQLVAGLVLAAATAAAARTLAAIYGEPELLRVVRWLALLFLLQSGGQTATALLKRELRFRELQMAQIASYVVGFCGAGIPLAMFGFGVWALVAAQLGQAMLYSAVVYRLAPHPLRPVIIRRDTTFQFGIQVIGTNLINWLITNMDGALVGRRFGATGLGIYNRGQVLITYQAANIASVLQNVLFSAYSRAQNGREQQREAYLVSVTAASAIFAPVFLTIAAAPRTVLAGLYGDRWLAAAPICVPLALAAPFTLVMSLAGPLLWANARVMAELRAQLITCSVAVGIFLAAAGISAQAVAWACFATSALRCGLMTCAVTGVLGMPVRQLVRNLRGAAAICLLACGVAFASDRLSETSHVPPVLRLVLVGMAAIGAMATATIIWPNAVLGPCLAKAARRNLALFPETVQAALRRLEP